MPRAIKPKPLPPIDDEIRQVMLQYFFLRNKNARSRFGKTGSFVKESELRRDLKASQSFTVQQVTSNLTYLLSMEWVEEKRVEKRIKTRKGTEFPSVTTYYIITAEGIDRIMGPSQFSKDKFHGIKVEATGQNIITIGDGNQINAKFQQIGEELLKFKEDIRNSSMREADKINVISDIDSIEAQLTKSEPNKGVIESLWQGIMRLVAAAGLVDYTTKVLPYIHSLIQ